MSTLEHSPVDIASPDSRRPDSQAPNRATLPGDFHPLWGRVTGNSATWRGILTACPPWSGYTPVDITAPGHTGSTHASGHYCTCPPWFNARQWTLQHLSTLALNTRQWTPTQFYGRLYRRQNYATAYRDTILLEDASPDNSVIWRKSVTQLSALGHTPVDIGSIFHPGIYQWISPLLRLPSRDNLTTIQPTFRRCFQPSRILIPVCLTKP